MDKHIIPAFGGTDALGAVLVALLYITLSSLLKEPRRQQLSAIIVAGAGAAYLSGGFGIWELLFCTIVTVTAFKGLKRYYFIGIAWLLHTVWDLLHHLYGNPIVPFSLSSSAGCAVCDAVLAVWFFMKAPPVFNFSRKTKAVSIKA